MKPFAALAGVAGLCCAGFYRPSAPPLQILILGNHQGYLSPCGCSSPMLGGILRQASVVRSLMTQGPSIVVDTGNITKGDSAQELMKAQTMAETLKSLKVAAVNLTGLDYKLGAGELSELQNLSGNAFVSQSYSQGSDLSVDKTKVAEGYLIGGLASGDSSTDASVEEFLSSAKEQGLKTLLMVEASEADVSALVKRHPGLDVVTYTSTAKPGFQPDRVGNTLLISPGEHGQYLVVLKQANGSSPDVSVIRLDESVPDDVTADRFYKTYLKRIDEDHLWESFPRRPGRAYAGAVKCGSCHTAAYKIWKGSGHAVALHTLVTKGHQKDPECLPCHVTGVANGEAFKTGFHTPTSDPGLAFVGCESCHGAGAAHASNPWKNSLPVVKATTCNKCHEPLNSPAFNFATYWKQIKH